MLTESPTPTSTTPGTTLRDEEPLKLLNATNKDLHLKGAKRYLSLRPGTGIADADAFRKGSLLWPFHAGISIHGR